MKCKSRCDVFFCCWYCGRRDRVALDARAGPRCLCIVYTMLCMQSVSDVGPRTQSIMMIENYGIRILLTALGRAHYRVCNV